jgi:hypothetical protein
LDNNKKSILSILLLFIVTLHTGVNSWELYQTNGNYVHWSKPTIDYWVNETGSDDLPPPHINEIIAIGASFSIWNDVTPSEFYMNYLGMTTNQHSITDGKNVVYWIKTHPFPNPIATTQRSYNSNTGIINDIDIALNDYWLWTLETFLIDSIYDIQSITTHEIGHFVSIDHTYETNGCPTMMRKDDWNNYCPDEQESPALGMRTLAQDDIDAINFLHTPPNAPSGLSVSGPVGGHPVLVWNENVEIDIDGYYIWRKLSDSQNQFYLIDSIGAISNPTYTDNSVTISSFIFAPYIHYYVTAHDIIRIVSDPSITRFIRYNPFKVLSPDNNSIPKNYQLHSNFPNPFNSKTTIQFDLPDDSNINLTIYNLLGIEIASLVNKNLLKGVKNINWDGTDNFGDPVPSGVYLYNFSSKSIESDKIFNDTKKMILLK